MEISCGSNRGGGGTDAAAEKPVMVVGVDESSHSFYALEWTLDRFFKPFAPNHPYRLVIVHARPSASSVLGIAGNVPKVFPPNPTSEPLHSNRIHRLGIDSGQLLNQAPIPRGAVDNESHLISAPDTAVADVTPIVDADLKRIADRVIEKGKDLCSRKSVDNVTVDVMEGDARSVMCEAADKHRAVILVVGSHGYGPMKRAVLGSVSDFCAHHAHCSVLIVKKPKSKP